MIKKDFDLGLFGIVPNKVITDYGISDSILAVYAVMRTLYFDINRSCSWCSINEILNILNVDISQGKQTKVIQEAITYLIEYEYIELLDFFNNKVDFDIKNKAIYKVSFLLENEKNCFTGSGGITKIPECNLINLLKYIRKNKGIKKYQLIRFYLLIARGCSNVGQLWSLSQKHFQNVIKISSKTCTEWNSILQEIGVIYYNSDYCSIRNGKFYQACTMYFHRNNNEEGYKNTVTIDEFNDIVAQKAESKGLTLFDKVGTNNKRSQAMKKIWADRKNVDEDTSDTWGEDTAELDNIFDEEIAI
ncbi:hypothetical protein DSECCO2_266300 [anaerobic digester metagenome]